MYFYEPCSLSHSLILSLTHSSTPSHTHSLSLKNRKLPPAIEPFQIPKSEIEHVLKTPLSMLSRKDVMVRKLMQKYHDDPNLLKRGAAAAAYGFDPHRAGT